MSLESFREALAFAVRSSARVHGHGPDSSLPSGALSEQPSETQGVSLTFGFRLTRPQRKKRQGPIPPRVQKESRTLTLAKREV